MHLQPVFSHCPSFNHGDDSFAASVFANGVCLPSGSNMTGEQQQRVIELISDLLSG